MAKTMVIPESALFYNKGTITYVKDGEIYQNASCEAILIESSEDLELLTSYDPGSIAFTAGYEHMWQKGADGTWAQII